LIQHERPGALTYGGAAGPDQSERPPVRSAPAHADAPKEHDKDFYITPYVILGAGTEKIRYAGGMDAIQSLQLAFEMIGNDLQQRFPRANIVWRGAKDHGFRTTIRRPQSDALPD